MSKKELDMLADFLAEKVVVRVVERLTVMQSNSDDEMIDSRAAAEMIGVCPEYMRKIKDKFPHIKIGQHGQGRILFRKKDIISSLTQ